MYGLQEEGIVGIMIVSICMTRMNEILVVTKSDRFLPNLVD